MVLNVQKSCYRMTFEEDLYTRSFRKKLARKQISKHNKERIHDTIKEVRIMSLTSSLPLTTYCGDEEFLAIMRGIAKQTLGDHVRERKIRAVFAKVGLRLAAPGISHNNETLLAQTLLSREEVLALSENWLVPEVVHERFRKRWEDYPSPGIITWANLKKRAKRHEYKHIVVREQAAWVRNELGLFSNKRLTAEAARKLRRRVQFKNVHMHENEDFYYRWNADLLLLGASSGPIERKTTACIINDEITLFPAFFFRVLTNIKETPHATINSDIRHICWRASVLLHEIMHNKSSLDTRDVKVRTRLACSFFDSEKETTSYMEGKHSAYGLERVLSLAKDSNRTDRSQNLLPEHNTDSWSMCCQFRLLRLIYPEYSFLPTVQSWSVQSWSIEDAWLIKRRPTLLHHCSVFDCLRTNRHKSITRLKGYDAARDPFSTRKNGKKKPATLSELLDLLLDLAEANRATEMKQYKEKAQRLLKQYRKREHKKTGPQNGEAERKQHKMTSNQGVDKRHNAKHAARDIPQHGTARFSERQSLDSKADPKVMPRKRERRRARKKAEKERSLLQEALEEIYVL